MHSHYNKNDTKDGRDGGNLFKIGHKVHLDVGDNYSHQMVKDVAIKSSELISYIIYNLATRWQMDLSKTILLLVI